MNQFQEDFFTEEVPYVPPKRPCIKCKKESPYQCPKCKRFYCNLECYQTHNLNCTEEFYKQNVIQHLKNKKVSKEDAKKMQDIIDRVKEGNLKETDPLTDKQIERLEEILDNLDSGEMTIDKLSVEELKEFEEFIKDKKNLDGLIKEWNPWWEREAFAYNIDIVELDQEEKSFPNPKEDKLYQYRNDMRKRYSDLPPIDKLTRIEPSPELIHHICQYLYGCVYVARAYNGDLKNCAEEVIDCINKLAPCLKEKISFGSIKVTLDKCIENSRKLDGADASHFIIQVLQDLITIFSNKFYLFEIIFRLYDIYHQVHEDLIDKTEGENKDKKDKKLMAAKKDISNIKQKLIFYLCYLKQKKQKDLSEISNQIKEYEHQARKDELLNKEIEKLVKNFDQNIKFS